MYRHPVVRNPTTSDVARLSDKLNFKLTEDEVKGFTDSLSEAMQVCDRMCQIPEPTLEVKYPRTPGYQPNPEDNPCNAWYWRTDIAGATKGKLFGKSLGIKDNIAVAGVPMMVGSKVMEGFVPDVDATVVTRILDAGGRILGKTVCENLCLSANSFTPLTGPVYNPYNQEYAAGGSSCGNGALLVGGHIDMAVGGDHAGSIRIPASFCGVVGLKPTHGLVPYTGAMQMMPSVGHLGPMARTVYDCALLLEVIAGYDQGLDPRQVPNIDVPAYTELIKDDLSGLKIGLIKEGFEGCKDGVDAICREAIDKLKTCGIQAEEVSIPLHNDSGAIFKPMVLSGVHEIMFNGAGVGYGVRGFHWTAMQQHMARGLRTHSADMSVTTKFAFLYGEYMKENYDHQFYSKACNLTRLLTKAYDDALQLYDVLVLPTVKFAPTKLPPSETTTKGLIDEGLHNVANTAPFNMTGHPALSLNAGFNDGLPIGLTIVGKHFDESTVFNVAHALEKVRY